MYVCLCHGVSEMDILLAIESGALNAERVGELTGAGTCCGACRVTIDEMIADVQAGGSLAHKLRHSAAVPVHVSVRSNRHRAVSSADWSPYLGIADRTPAAPR